jgi:hypothetical protein
MTNIQDTDMYMKLSGEMTLDKYDTTNLWEDLKSGDMFQWNEESAIKVRESYFYQEQWCRDL